MNEAEGGCILYPLLLDCQSHWAEESRLCRAALDNGPTCKVEQFRDLTTVQFKRLGKKLDEWAATPTEATP